MNMTTNTTANGRALRWCTRLAACALMALAASCVTSRNYMVCNEIRKDNRFIEFDTTYVSARSIPNKWMLDSLQSYGISGLSDTLIIGYYELKTGFPPKRATMQVKSDSTYYRMSLHDCYPTNITRYSRRGDKLILPNGRSGGRIYEFEKLVFSWDIATIRRLLEGKRNTCMTVWTIIRAVRDGDRIKQLEEYTLYALPEEFSVSSDDSAGD